MPKSVEELEKMFDGLSSKLKDVELKYESAERDAKHFKAIAETREEELRKFREQVEQSEKEKAAALAKARESDVKQFVEDLIKEGKIAPASKEKIVAFANSLSEQKELCFTESDGKKITYNQLAMFKDIFNSMKKSVPVNDEYSVTEQSGSDPISEIEGEEQHFMEIRKDGAIQKLPMKDEILHIKALEYIEEKKKKGFTVSYEEALISVFPKRKPSQVK